MSIDFQTPIASDSSKVSTRRAEANASAVGQIRAFIDAGDAANGRLPPERVLAEDLGISRRAIRYALDLLEAEGRIRRQQGRGTFVCDARAGAPDLSCELAKLTNPVDTLEARMAIEPALARLAALRATRADFDKLFEAAEAFASARLVDVFELSLAIGV